MADLFAQPADTPPAKPSSITVAQLTQRVKTLLEGHSSLQNLLVQGELSNFKLHSSGHAYFTLKDAQSELPCVMFRAQYALNRFKDFRDGDRVLAKGKLTVYAPRGRYQLQVTGLQPDGEGELYRRFLRLKEQLQTEGLFDASRKKPLPRHLQRVVVLTSATGAVIRDIVSTLRRRGAVLELLLIPTAVQGAAAAGQLLRGLQLAQELPGVDAIVLARGGGSMEDLWSFNDEALARAIAASKVPVISAVGHETDFTIADFVADLRAATPTAAAELLAPERSQLLGELAYVEEVLNSTARAGLETERQRLDDYFTLLEQGLHAQVNEERMALNRAAEALSWHIQRGLERERNRLLGLEQRIAAGQLRQLLQARGQLAGLEASLVALDPDAVLARGYSMSFVEGKRLRSAEEATPGVEMLTKLADGETRSIIL